MKHPYDEHYKPCAEFKRREDWTPTSGFSWNVCTTCGWIEDHHRKPTQPLRRSTVSGKELWEQMLLSKEERYEQAREQLRDQGTASD